MRSKELNGNSFIAAAELTLSMASLGHTLTAEELTGVIRQACTDDDGRISFQEFSDAISSAVLHNSWT